MAIIRTALIGCGTIAMGRHVPVYKQIQDIHITHCVDLIESRAAAAALELGGAKTLTDYKELTLCDIDAVIICTPNGTHAQIVTEMLTANKHVFCEKPLTVDYPTAVELKALADKTGKILDVGVCNRFRKAVIKVRELIQGGAIGELYHTYCSFRKHRAIPGLGGDYTTKSKSGGGVLIDWGVHLFDLILHCASIDTVNTVSAATHNRLSKDISAYEYISMWAGPSKLDGISDVEDTVTGLIRTDKGTISFNGAWAQNLEEENMFIEFLGTKGGIKVQYYDKYTVFTSSNGVFYNSAANFNDNDMFLTEITAYVDSINTGIKNVNNVDNVLVLQQLLDTIYKSARLNKEIAL